MLSTASAVLEHCNFADNHAGSSGGAVHCYSTIPNTGRLSNCHFWDNLSNRGGGAVYWSTSSRVQSIQFESCTFSTNVSCYGSILGGGGALELNSGDFIVRKCGFFGNTSYEEGGAVHCRRYNHRFENCFFAGNRAIKSGGAISYYGTYGSSNSELVNCTFAQNIAINGNAYGNTLSFDSSSQQYPAIVNISDSILADDQTLIYNLDGSTIAINHSCVTNGYPGLGNIADDPCFVSLGYWDDNGTVAVYTDDTWTQGDYHLKSQVARYDSSTGNWVQDAVTSPCIDGGNPGREGGDELHQVMVAATPVSGNLRINMGYYGGSAEASLAGSFGWKLADINNDAVTGLADFTILAQYWLAQEEDNYADLNRDEIVNLLDLYKITQDW